MKKVAVCVLAVLILLLGGCMTLYEPYFIVDTEPFVTDQPEGYVFETCEPVELYLTDEQTGVRSLAASVCIRNVLILDRGDIRMRDGEETLCGEVLVQVNYEILKHRGDITLGSNNILCVDVQGNSCGRIEGGELDVADEYTAYNQMFFVVPVEGEYVEIQLHIGTETERKIIPIRCYYGVGEQEEDPENLKVATESLVVLGGILLVLGVVIVFLYRKRKQLRSIHDTLQKQVEQMHPPLAPSQATDGGAEK